MKYTAILLLMAFTIAPNKTKRALFNEFHTIYAKGDFAKMEALLTDDFTGLDEKGAVSFTKREYIDYMAGWNKVFATKWNIVRVKEAADVITSVEYDTDLFNNYFYDGRMKYLYTYTFRNNQISSIRVDPMPGADKIQAVFKERFGAFYNWVAQYYPDRLPYCTQSSREAAIEVKAMLQQYLAKKNK